MQLKTRNLLITAKHGSTSSSLPFLTEIDNTETGKDDSEDISTKTAFGQLPHLPKNAHFFASNKHNQQLASHNLPRKCYKMKTGHLQTEDLTHSQRLRKMILIRSTSALGSEQTVVGDVLKLSFVFEIDLEPNISLNAKTKVVDRSLEDEFPFKISAKY